MAALGLGLGRFILNSGVGDVLGRDGHRVLMRLEHGVEGVDRMVGVLVEGALDDLGDGAEVDLIVKERFDGGFVGGVEDDSGAVGLFDDALGEIDRWETGRIDGLKVERSEGREIER